MKTIATRFIATIGTFGSMIALVVSLHNKGERWTAWQIVLLTLFTIFGAVALVLDVRDSRPAHQHTIRTNKKIKEYMHAWISKGATAAIFSRSLGWAAEDPRIHDLLKERALSGSIALILPRETPLSKELADLGAQVYYYPDIEYVIRARFTIIDADRSDSRVAIGRFVDDQLVVDEFSPGRDPAFYLAHDLFELVRRLSSLKKGAS